MIPVFLAAVLLSLSTFTVPNIYLTMSCLALGAAGMKAYMPAFWSLPSLFLTSTAAAGSIGMINSIGNLGGFLGPTVMGYVETKLKSYEYGLYFLSATSLCSACLILLLPLRDEKATR